jgi:hypothetical protein
MKKLDINLIIFLAIIIIYIAGQFLIGTYDPNDKKFVFDAPSDVDFLYYGAIINSLFNDFPPQNPAFAGVELTQPYLQYYPAAILAKIFNPYNSIRLLNVLYLVLFGLLLKKYFPRRYGIPLIVLFVSSSLFVDINAIGVDFIARGFTHVPFFILITVVLFEKRLSLRLLAVFIAALVNGYLMLIFGLYLGVILLLYRNRENLYILISAVLGLVLASLIVSSQAVEKPFYFVLTESFGFNPVEIIKHAVPFLIFAFICRQKSMTLLLIISIIFGALIHYNPFFPVFMVYFAGAMLLAAGELKINRAESLIYSFLVVLFIGFIISSYDKYATSHRHYFPRYDTRIDKAVAWIKDNTKSNSTFMALTADNNDLGLIMQYRPVYLGYIGHISHLGLNWRPRYDDLVKLYKIGKIPSGIDYIFYGPLEKKYFPQAPIKLPICYQDNFVEIFKVE